jgi:aminoglycoside phosphotransferase (APT) family kinase protein
MHAAIPGDKRKMDQQEAVRLARRCFPDAKIGKIRITSVCRLWAGMGYIYELNFGSTMTSLIVKCVDPDPDQVESLGGRRKAASYKVEAHFYEAYAIRLIDDHGLQLPRPHLVECNGDHRTTVCMSKLEQRSAGNNNNNNNHSGVDKAVIVWLAKLHAVTWGHDAEGLQPIGSYWYLDTRPDEHASMPKNGWQGRLKRAARAIDSRLQRDPMQCIIHGDAKEDNILWCNNDGEAMVAMCDFQYCGRGPPTRDLAYFLCTSTDPDEEDALLLLYYEELIKNLSDAMTRPSLEQLKESLELAYCDYARFMSGWGFWGNDISKRVVKLLKRLDGGVDLGSDEAYEEAVRREFG